MSNWLKDRKTSQIKSTEKRCCNQRGQLTLLNNKIIQQKEDLQKLKEALGYYSDKNNYTENRNILGDDILVCKDNCEDVAVKLLEEIKWRINDKNS